MEKEGVLGLRHLLGRPLILYRRYERLILEEFSRQSIHPDVFACAMTREMPCWVKAGLATAIFPQSMHSLCTGLRIQPVEEKALETQTVLIWKKRRIAFAGGTRFFTGLSSISLKNGKKNGRAAFAARPRCCQAVLKFVKCHAVDVIIHERWAGRQRQFFGILCHLFGFFAQCAIEKQHGGTAKRTVADKYGFVLQSGRE